METLTNGKIPQPETLGVNAMHVALTQEGVTEQPVGSNWGPKIKEYLAVVKIDFPASWCMGFVQWCVKQAIAGRALKESNPLPISGKVLDVWRRTPEKYKIHDTTKAKAGDIFIMDFGNDAGHTGFVTSCDGHRIQTIEGNSNLDGSREGKMVDRKPNGRPCTSIKGLIRI